MIGKTISRYRITEQLGEGGMGVVYRARDEHLDRDVAIKVLPEEFASDPRRLARFEIEAKALARLSHPNIMEIFDFGREGEVTFAVTEFLLGEDLCQRLEGTRLTWRQAAGIGAAIADGLAAARRAGIVHRDLKPSNIFLTADGRVKVLDFGLARTIDLPGTEGTVAPTMTSHTLPGSVLGTVGYMSPEQVRGEPADHRSDMFSLGCVLYEMLAGRRAFACPTAAETMSAILRADPLGLGAIAPDSPPAMVNAIRRCLEKNPDARFQSGRDLAFVLRSISREETGQTPPEPVVEKSILVLPFTNLSADADNEFFSDGLTEELITDLASVKSLRVISRTSAMRLKGTDKGLRQISRELNTQYALEGSVRKAGNNLRITAQLIDARSDTHLWSEKYSGTIDDVFDIQEKVSRSIVDALKVKLNPEESRKIAERPIEDIQAYECYLRARGEMWRGPVVGLERALHHLEMGLEIVGDNVLLNAGMAEVYLQYYEFGYKTDEATIRNAAKYIAIVKKMVPDSAEGYYLSGRIERLTGTALKAVRQFERAYSLNPKHASNLLYLGGTYAIQVGRPNLGEPFLKKLIEIDPLTPLSRFILGLNQILKGDLDHALKTFQDIYRMESDNWFATLFIIVVLAWQNKYSEACRLIDEMVRTGDHEQVAEWCRFFKCALQGQKEQALETLSDKVKEYYWNDPELPWLGAEAYSLLGEKEEAIDWIEHAVDRGWINYPLFARDDPLLENIRGEKRFQELMARIKPRWEEFEARASLDEIF